MSVALVIHGLHFHATGRTSLVIYMFPWIFKAGSVLDGFANSREEENS